MSKSSWAEQDAARVGAEVKRLRGPRSGQWLSDRTAEVGHRLTRTMISELETEKRTYVSTAELVVLAEALNVAPVALLYPSPYDEDIEITPGKKMSKIAAVEWFSGIIDPLSVDHDPEYRRNMLDLIRARQVRELQHTRRNLAEQLRILDGVVDSSVTDTLAAEVTRVSKVLEELRISYGG